jgi:hypothetical protein
MDLTRVVATFFYLWVDQSSFSLLEFIPFLYDQAQTLLLEAEYEPVEGRLAASEM